jgi:hypothetical protein
MLAQLTLLFPQTIKTVKCDTVYAISKNNTSAKDKRLLKIMSGLKSESFENTLPLVHAACAKNT